MFTKGKWFLALNGQIRVKGRALEICQMPFKSARQADEMPEDADNARLIAGTPNLLAVLNLGLSLQDTDKSVGKGAGRFSSKVVDWVGFWETARQAIANAEPIDQG